MQTTELSFKTFFSTRLANFESHLTNYLTFNSLDDRKKLESAMQYAVAAGGKRIRPILCMITQDLLEKPVEEIFPLASAIEMIHAYSLIHDDLPAMDNDDLRRGKPTTHIQFGEDIAILAGDTLNSYAFEVLAKELPKQFKAEQALSTISTFANLLGIEGLAGGQVLDIMGNANIGTEAQLKSIHLHKTGKLIEGCFTLPGILNTVSENTQTALTQIGKDLGLLYQIVDDILDVTSESETLGKTAKKDIAQNKMTYVTVFGLEKAQSLCKTQYQKCQSFIETCPFKSTESLIFMLDFIYNRTF